MNFDDHEAERRNTKHQALLILDPAINFDDNSITF